MLGEEAGLNLKGANGGPILFEGRVEVQFQLASNTQLSTPQCHSWMLETSWNIQSLVIMPLKKWSKVNIKWQDKFCRKPKRVLKWRCSWIPSTSRTCGWIFQGEPARQWRNHWTANYTAESTCVVYLWHLRNTQFLSPNSAKYNKPYCTCDAFISSYFNRNCQRTTLYMAELCLAMEISCPLLTRWSVSLLDQLKLILMHMKLWNCFVNLI